MDVRRLIASRRSGPLLAALLILASAVPARAQYFGQNKVQYEKFDFKVLHTTHFNIYYYPEEEKAGADVARMAERWYVRLSTVLGHELRGMQPVILYASHPQFIQTNVVEGEIDEATGGVTEGQLRRVTLPLAPSLAETDHVLGHELVHAFQYDILGPNENVPLWFIEGMAEYLSRGPRDVETSMWMRDALLHEKLPAIKDLDNPKYFPYRFGDAFWAYVGGRWGDRTIGEILRNTASLDGRGTDDPMNAIERATGVTIKLLSDEWQKAVRDTYVAAAPKTEPNAEPAHVIGKTTGSGRLNVGPAISPDGSKIAFLSGREQLSIDLYVADALTGKVTHKLIGTATDPHFESLQFIESAGSWDPTGKQLAVATVRRGRPVIAIVNGANGHIDREIPFPTLGEIFQPAWSPDGHAIAFSAHVGGYTDLYVYDLNANTTRRLTDDAFADLEPVWTPDGKHLTFVSDREGADLANLSFRGYHLSSIDLDTAAVTPVVTNVTGNTLNPQWSGDGSALYFVSDAGGLQNVYRLDVATGQSTPITGVPTGVTGITPLSPALSVAARGNTATLTVFQDGGYDLQILALPGQPATPITGGSDEARLPPANRQTSLVADLLSDPVKGLPTPAAAAANTQQKVPSGLKLLGISGAAGVSTFTGFGTFGTGGISFLFSDMLGNHLLGATFQVNGDFRDIAAVAQYINRTSRWNWGLFGGVVPLLSATGGQGLTTVNGQTVAVNEIDLFRETDTQVGALVQYPFSRVTRVEFNTAWERIGFSETINQQFFDPVTGFFLGQQQTTQPLASALHLGTVGAALIRDDAAMGPIDPLTGTQARVEVDPAFGDLRFTSVAVDYRRYVMPVRPVTFAGRLVHEARYGSGGEDPRLFPLFLGYPWLVRGYDPSSFSANECTASATSSCQEFDRLFGSRLLVLNGEIRVPAAGLFTGRLTYGPVPVELFAFGDAGVAWTSTDKPAFAGGPRQWITSVGGGARVNVFGFVVAEFALAKPLQRPLSGWRFIFNLGPTF